MNTVFSCSRGLGLEFVRQLVARGNNIIFATCRNVEAADKLAELHRSPEGQKNIHIIRLDVANESSIDEACTEVGRILDERQLPLDYLINNAGVVRPARTQQPLCY